MQVVWGTKIVFKTVHFVILEAASTDLGVPLMVMSRLQ